MASADRDAFRAAIKKAEAKAAARMAKQKEKSRAAQTRRARASLRIAPKHETRDDKEPTTAALEKWGPQEYLGEFHKHAKLHVRGYNQGPNQDAARAHMKFFLEALDLFEACPRAKLTVVRTAASRLLRYKKEWRIGRRPANWWLRTFGDQIIDDLKGLIYTKTSLRYLYTEEIPIDMLKIEETSSGWVIHWEDHQARLHRSQLQEVTNPFLLAKLSKPIPKESDHDDEDYGGW